MKKKFKRGCRYIMTAIKGVLGALIVIVIGTMYSCEMATNTVEINTSEVENIETTEVAGGSTEATSFNVIFVHVTGQVNHAGVYELKEGSRVYEAIEVAGGFTEEADTQFLNLASVLYDGQRIYVYSKEESATAKTIHNSDGSSGSKKVIININTASKEQLMTLPGIGESRAESIIAYREENGGFSSIEDIMNVSGIKEAAFKKIKEYICAN